MINHDFSVDKCADNFTSNLMKSVYSPIPNKHCLIRNKDKPWMRNNVRKELRRRKRLHREAKHDNTPESWATYRFQRNKVISLVRKAKK